jgi:hypothetical protein
MSSLPEHLQTITTGDQRLQAMIQTHEDVDVARVDVEKLA